jgi:hypothetical protein
MDLVDGTFLWFVSANVSLRYMLGSSEMPYMVVYLPEHLLWRYYQAHDLPYGHLEVHLRKFEQALEEARHSDLIPPC